MGYKTIQTKLYTLIKEIKVHNKYNIRRINQKCENSYNKKLWATSLYLSGIDIMENIASLLNNNNPIAIPNLVRSYIDVYVNLLNVIDRYDYFIRNEKRLLINEINYLHLESKKLSDEEIHKLFEIGLIENYERQLTELKGVKPVYISEKEKRKKINLEDDVKKFYGLFSNHIHNAITPLSQRHIIKKKGGFYASLSKKLDKSIVYIALWELLKIFPLYIGKYHKFMCSPKYNAEEILSALKECQKIVLKYLPK